MVFEDENFNILGVHWKIQLLWGDQYWGGALPKKEGLGRFADLRGAWQERGELILTILIQPCIIAFFKLDSLHATLNSHYEA